MAHVRIRHRLAHHDAVALATAWSLDAQLLAAFLPHLLKHPSGALATAAMLLDADRRGRTFSHLALAVVHACMAEISKNAGLGETDRAGSYGELAEQIDTWGLAQLAPDACLAQMVASADLGISADILEFGDEEDVLSLIEALVAHQREGFTLFWLARRVASDARLVWSDVAREANRIMTHAAGSAIK